MTIIRAGILYKRGDKKNNKKGEILLYPPSQSEEPQNQEKAVSQKGGTVKKDSKEKTENQEEYSSHKSQSFSKKDNQNKSEYIKQLEEADQKIHKELDKVTKQKAHKKSPKQNETNESTRKLEDLVIKSQQLLLKVSTVFPFDFFPTDVVIDQYKVNIIHRQFFAAESTVSIPVPDIKSVTAETAPLFATLRIVTDSFAENQTTVRYLKRSDAEKAQKIIEGLIISDREKIDTTQLSVKQAIDQIERLGSSIGAD